ncbi:MAG TPA: TonB family protein [Polyangiaceae bacterium]|nr:TonB family protein [Polyangiaceae bacterium]
MRLAISILAAAVLHGVAFGVTAAVVAVPSPVARLAAETVEVDLLPARPDPALDSAPALAKASPSQTHFAPAPIHQQAEQPATRDLESASDSEWVVPAATASAPTADLAPRAAAPSLPTPAPASTSSARVAPSPARDTVASAKPRYRSNPRPDYPLPSRRRREEGIVLLNVVVEVDGLPGAVSLNRSSGYPLLDRAALDAVRQWTFEPARAAGVAVPSAVVIPVRFDLSDE